MQTFVCMRAYSASLGWSWLNEPMGLVCVLWEDKRIKGDASVQ